jgi:hypothetical protein
MKKILIAIAACILTFVSCKKSKPEMKVEKISGDVIEFYNNVPQPSTHSHRALCLNHSKRTFFYWTTSDGEVDKCEYSAKGTFQVGSNKVELLTDFGRITMIINKDNSLVHHAYMEPELSTKNGWLLTVSEFADMNNPFRR